jgi:L-ascorbate metabolism protein UlaG (beta-lactamase superfamily)
MGRHFVEINNRFGPFRLALLPIGAYLPRWFMHPVHISPEEAVELHYTLQPSVSMAIHFGTFALGDDGEFEPVVELRQALTSRGETEARFWVLEHGEGRDVP